MKHLGEWNYPDAPDPVTYFESKDFKAYQADISRIVHGSPMPVTVAHIHRELGARSPPRWTADALDMISDIEPVGMLPTRYRPLTRRIAGLTRPDAERGTMGRIFPNQPEF